MNLKSYMKKKNSKTEPNSCKGKLVEDATNLDVQTKPKIENSIPTKQNVATNVLTKPENPKHKFNPTMKNIYSS